MVPGADGWDGRRSASNRSKERDSSMMQIVPHRYWRGRGGGVAVRIGRVRLAAVGAAVLSRAAADPDRGARLEPLGGADRGGFRLGRPRRRVRRLSSSSPSWSASGCRPGGSAISRCWRGPRRGAGARRLEWYPVGHLVVWAGARQRADRDRRDAQFRHRRGELPRRVAQRARAHAAPAGPRAERRRRPVGAATSAG